MKLIEELKNAQEKRHAMWHFNVGSYEQWLGIKKAVKKTGESVVVATSEGEAKYVPSKILRLWVDDARAEGLPIYVGADHRKNSDAVHEAIEGRVNVIVLDASHSGYDENIAYVKKMSRFCKQELPEILTEGEIGFIGASSEIHETLDASLIQNLPSAALINKFIDETAVDLVAPALGTVHGMVKGGNPMIDIAHIQKICSEVKAPVVLHGASGLSMETLKKVRTSGVALIHINTDIRMTMRVALEQTLKDHTEVAPYKYLTSVVDAVAEKVEEFLTL